MIQIVQVVDEHGTVRPFEDIERDVLRVAMGACRWKYSAAARELGLGRSTLYRRVRELEIEVPKTAAGRGSS